MEYYHHLYRDSPMWDGSSLDGKTIIVYMEQGLGDCIQMYRYVSLLGTSVIIHTSSELKELFEYFGHKVITKDIQSLPDHDCHVLSLSLPFIFEDEIIFPYIGVKECNLEIDGAYSDYIKIGIAWEGRSHKCPLWRFNCLQKANTKIFMLQNEIKDKRLLECSQIDLLGVELRNMLDTAILINTMDFVVTVDTCILHLAGAMNKKTYGILDKSSDPRWYTGNLYPSVKLLEVDQERQPTALRTVAIYEKLI